MGHARGFTLEAATRYANVRIRPRVRVTSEPDVLGTRTI